MRSTKDSVESSHDYPKLATPLQKGAKTEVETAGNAVSTRSTETLQKASHDLPETGGFFVYTDFSQTNPP